MTGLSVADYRRLSARDLRAAYRDRSLSPVDVAEAALAAIEESNPALNAVTFLDVEGALTQARRSEERWESGAPAGPLDGVPTLVKDGLLLRGVPVYRGTAALGRRPVTPESDAPAVARLREEGALLLGKTTMCDLGMMGSGYSSQFGPTRNPWNPARTSGGSSSGSAAAVAAGLVPVAVGTDIVGSIRLPAGFCGLAGLKPSYGRVPFYPNSSPAAVAGPLARDVEDLALLLSTIARPDQRDFAALPYEAVSYETVLEGETGELRIGYLAGLGFGPEPDPAVTATVEGALRLLEALGCRVEPLETPFAADEVAVLEDFYRLRPFHELQLLSEEERQAAAVITGWAAPAAGFSGLDHYRQFLATQALREKTLALIGAYDFLALPTAPMVPFAAELPAPEGHSIFAPFTNTLLFNLTEQPAVSLFCGLTPEGLPAGLQLVGRRHDDLGLLRLALAYERARGPAPFPPL